MLITHLYDRAILNGAALRACGYTKDTPNPPRAMFARDKTGNPTGLVVTEPDPWILYATMAKAPKLSPEDQKNSTRHFMRDLNRFGVTGINDAGGGFFAYPQDYQVAKELAIEGLATVRMAYNLLPQAAGTELAEFEGWVKELQPNSGDDVYRHNGAGEMLVYSAGDFEDFRQVRPDLPTTMEQELERVTRLLAENGWPFRFARDLRRIDRSGARRLRARQTRTSPWLASIGSSIMLKRSRHATSIGWPRLGAASLSSIGWPTKANTSSKDTERRRRNRRLPSNA